MQICLHLFLGHCKGKCTRDEDINHHPNNHDCVRYVPIQYGSMEVTAKKEAENESQRQQPNSPSQKV
jgi:hypothetical protein